MIINLWEIWKLPFPTSNKVDNSTIGAEHWILLNWPKMSNLISQVKGHSTKSWAFDLRSSNKKFDVDMYKDTRLMSVYSFTFNFKGEV